MLKLLLTALLGVLLLPVTAQMLGGHIYQAGTQNAIANASVYYNNSLTGTLTDGNGSFELALRPGKNALTVSCVGYTSTIVTNYSAAQSLTIYLEPKIHALNEVTIGNDGMASADKINLFKKEFLGTSRFALGCTITNLADVNLIFDKASQTLTADCDKPIQIENKLLGYRISYFLNRFEKTPTNTIISGNLLFKEWDNEVNKRLILQNREAVYNGSRMQFIRAVWYNSLPKSKFEIYTHYSRLLNTDSMITTGWNHEKLIKLDAGVLIKYSSDPPQLSRLAKTDEAFYIGRDGFSDANLKWSGRMGVQRVGDMLPFEYKSPKENYGDIDVEVPETVVSYPVSIASQTKAFTKSDTKSVDLFYEKAYLHTDRDVYAPGEDIWFKAYLVNAQNNKPINYSHNLYVELISPALKVEKHLIVRMDNGLGNGDFNLPDTVSAGIYRIRAYTNYMRNFGDKFIFEKDITVLGSAAKIGAVVIPKPIKRLRGKPQVKTYIDTLPAGPLVRFFPEGGPMSDDVQSAVAVRAEDEFGRGIPVVGQVVASSGRVVAKFSCDSLGMGMFMLWPDETQKYHAEVTIKGMPYSFKVPDAWHKGFVLSVNTAPDAVIAQISCNGFMLNEAAGNSLVITMTHGGRIYHKQLISVNSKSALLMMPDVNLPEGIACVTLYNEFAKPLCERLVYIHHPGNAKAVLSTDKAVYQSKEKVTVKIKISDTTAAYLSFAAIDAGLAPVQPENILSYLTLRSELKGEIAQPERYFDTTNVNRFKQLDLLLLTQGWRNFVWQRLSDSVRKIKYEVEQGINITGRVRKVFSNQPLKDMSITMFAPKAETQKLFSAVTDSVGRFTIYGALIYGYQYLNLTSRRADKMRDGQSVGKSSGWIQVDSLDLDKLPVGPVLIHSTGSTEYKSDSLIAMSAKRRKFSFTGNNVLKTVQIKSNLNAIPPEIHHIGPDEQKEYGSLMHYLLYLIPGAHEEEGGCHTDITPQPILKLNRFTQERKIPIFGVYVDHSYINYKLICDDDYLEQPMINVLSVTIRRKETAEGLFVIVFLVLKPGVLDKLVFDNAVADITGYQKARVFYAPRYETAATKPDYRTTIHWEPNITTDKNGEATITYYNANPKTKVQLVLQGVTDKGIPLVATGQYEVK